MPGLKIAQVATADVSIRYLLLDHIQHLQSLGHEVTAVCNPGPHVDDIRSHGVRVETVRMHRELRPFQDLRTLQALRDCFRKNDFDVVHTHTPKAGLLGPMAARWARVPVVVHTIHGLLFHDAMPRWRRALFWLPEKWTATLCDFLLSQSREDIGRAVRTHICRVQKIAYVGNGIDIGRFSEQKNGARAAALKEAGIAGNKLVIGSVGRLVAEKGFREFFAAAEKLKPAHPEIEFLVIGPEEPDQDDAIDPLELKRLADNGIVHFLPWQNAMEKWYGSMDVFVLPSYREGIPRACMEAACSGRPVVATDIRGCREVVKDGETGILVPPRDVPKLTNALERMIADATMRAEMGRKGREHIQANFNAKTALQRLGEFYSLIEPLVAKKRKTA